MTNAAPEIAGSGGVELDSPAAQEGLLRYLQQQAGASQLAITHMARLSGGAIQENWALDVNVEGGPYAGRQAWVLRTDAQSAVAVSLSRSQEFAVLSVAHGAGVVVPQPLWLCRDPQVLGREFYIMRRVSGVA